MMRWTRPAAVALALVLTATACGDDDAQDAQTSSGDTAAEESETTGAVDSAEGTVTIEHYSGTDEVPVQPETVVVMDPGVLLSLHSLGIEVDGYGSLGGAVPEEHADVLGDPDLAAVGTAFEPDYEAINALEPDLIIVATRSSATYPEMKRIAPTVDLTMDEGSDFTTAFRERHEALGQIFGVEDEVATQLDELEDRIDAVAERGADAGTALILMTSGTEVSAYGPGSRFGLVHDVLGFEPADEDLSQEATHGEAVSFEFVLEAAPDVLVVIDRSAAIGEEGEAAARVLDNGLVRQTPAWEDERVLYTDSFAWYIVSHSIPGLERVLDDVESILP